MQQEFARVPFERGVVIGIRASSDLLATHFPSGEGAKPTELPDRPIVLSIGWIDFPIGLNYHVNELVIHSKRTP